MDETVCFDPLRQRQLQLPIRRGLFRQFGDKPTFLGELVGSSQSKGTSVSFERFQGGCGAFAEIAMQEFVQDQTLSDRQVDDFTFVGHWEAWWGCVHR